MSGLFALSFSRVSTYESCPAKFDYLYVTKSAKDEDNEFTLYGHRVHSALEKYGRCKALGTAQAVQELSDGTAFDEVRAFLPLVDQCLNQKGTVYFEFQMAIRADHTPCDWFDKATWLRAVADVLIVDNEAGVAYMLDWKTGKVKANPFQLKLFALMVFALFPTVTMVKTAFVWLQHGDVTIDTYFRSTLDATWKSVQPRLDVVQESVNLGVYRATPSGLCRYCPAKKICPSARR